MEAVNRSGLVFFVLANVLTALVNVVMETRHVHAFIAMTVMICFYMFTLSLVAALMHVRNITTVDLYRTIIGFFSHGYRYIRNNMQTVSHSYHKLGV